MSEQKSDAAVAAGKAGSLWAEVGPAVAFVIVYNVLLRFPETGLFSKDTALYWATGILMAATFAAVTVKLVNKQPVPPLLIISSVIIGGFGAAGIFLQSKLFLFIKPTIVNLVYASVIFGGLAVGRNIWKMLLKNAFDLPDHAWNTLAIRWGCFFVFMAAWNEFLWRNFSEATWANWKVGNFAFVVVFMLANTPYTLKHLRDAEPAPAD